MRGRFLIAATISLDYETVCLTDFLVARIPYPGRGLEFLCTCSLCCASSLEEARVTRVYIMTCMGNMNRR